MFSGVAVMKRCAFTLVELLAVIAVISVLAALLLPAVQVAREVGRRAQCHSNLRQLGLAVHSFESARHCLPPAGFWRTGQNIPESMNKLGVTPYTDHSWMVFLLEYVEQSNVGDTYNRSCDSLSPANANARSARLPILRCPSSPARDELATMGSPFGIVSGGTSDYVVCRRLDEPLARSLGFVGTPGDLVSFYSALPPRQVGYFSAVVDGLSNTLMITESAARNSHYITGQHVVNDVPLRVIWAATDNTMVLVGHTPDGLTWPGPCMVNCSNVNGLYAFHTSGACGVLADGSVRMIETGIDVPTMAALVTRAGND
jgi:prepilin-type N-terminal cleavage/methylation domain-containing protein